MPCRRPKEGVIAHIKRVSRSTIEEVDVITRDRIAGYLLSTDNVDFWSKKLRIQQGEAEINLPLSFIGINHMELHTFFRLI
jgi:hypothetical protein